MFCTSIVGATEVSLFLKRLGDSILLTKNSEFINAVIAPQTVTFVDYEFECSLLRAMFNCIILPLVEKFTDILFVTLYILHRPTGIFTVHLPVMSNLPDTFKCKNITSY